MSDILQRDGLTLDILHSLSYRSQLGISLKRNLHYFDKDSLFREIEEVNAWYDESVALHELPLDYRVKSVQSAIMKYERYFPDYQARKVFDDLLGFRSLVDNYEEVLSLTGSMEFRVADLSRGKAVDDGYRGVHLYFQVDNHHYPIEIQYNTYYDRQLNNWLHKYIYKRSYSGKVGSQLRSLYETGVIQTEKDFKEALSNVLFSGEK